MKVATIIAVLGGIAVPAHAAPFRPFVDAIGVTPSGVIVTTTTHTGQSDRPVAERHALMMFAPDGAELFAFRVEAFVDHGVAIDRGQWRALDRWLATLRLQRVAARPLAELRCATQPGPGDTPCPARTDALVRTATGIARWNPDGAQPAWAWGTPEVAELGDTCVLLWPNNRGDLDRIEAATAPCPPP